MNRILNFLLTTALFIYIGEYALEKYEFMVLGRQINIEHLTALLEANIQIADSIKHPLPKYFNLSCRAGFMKTNCEIVLYGHDSLIPLRLETDFYRHSEVTDWDPAHLERFPILTFAELLAADLQLSDRSQIQFNRLVTWDAHIVKMEGIVKSDPPKRFRSTFTIENFRWKLAPVSYF